PNTPKTGADRGAWLHNGAIPPGKLTGVMAAAACGVRGGGYVPLHVGAAVERRDEAEEVQRPLQQGPLEFPGIVEGRIPRWIRTIKQMSGRRQAQPESRQLR